MCKKFIFLLLYIAVSEAQNLFAQTLTGADAGKIIAGTERIILDATTQLPAYVEFQKGRGPKTTDFAFWLKGSLNMSAALGLSLINTETDKIGFEHVRYEQTYYGFPVNHSMILVHSKNGSVVSFNGEYVTRLSVKTEATISESRALEIAKKSIGAQIYKWELKGEEAFLKREQHDEKATFFPTAERMLVKTKTNGYVLGYRFDIYAHKPVSRQYVFVDAMTGEILAKEERIHEATVTGSATTAYSGVRTIKTDLNGVSYRLREAGRGLGIQTLNMKTAGTNYGAAVDFTDSDNLWNNVNANLDQYATDAHFGAEMTYDYFKLKHLRNSIDNAGFALLNYVHADLVGFGLQNNINAFWDGSRMTYGDGGSGYTPFTSLDITGHEITHGLTEKTAKLVYSAEPGALNEGFSDIFGTAVEFYGKTGRSSGNWTMGEEVGPTPIRNMANPNQYNQADTYHGDFWYTGGSDNGGVHFNSGVLNFWFYLLCQGGTGVNDIENAYNVKAIGMAKASAIAYKTLTHYLTPNSTFAMARQYSIQSAIDLYGNCSPEVVATTNAWFAVGIGTGILPAVISASGPLTVCSGSGVFLNATTGAVSYQWKLNGIDIAGATNPVYSAFAPGSYTVFTVYCGGSFLSAPSVVNMVTPVVGVSPAGSVSACFGSSYGLTAITSPGYKIQWNKNGMPIPGANAQTYLAASTGSYSVTTSGTNYPAHTFINTTPLTIPNPWVCTSVSSSIAVSGVPTTVPSSIIQVKINVTQNFVEELSLFLQSPTGEILGLVKNTSPYRNNYTNTVFTDGGASLITGTGEFTGSFKPYPNTFTSCSITSGFTTFGSLGGGTINPNGTWKLLATNTGLSSIGTLKNWEITFSAYTVPALSCNPVTSPATLVTILPAFNPGTISSGDQSSCIPFDPNPITMSVNPSGSGAYKYQWYYWPDPNMVVPLDVTTGTTSFTDSRFFGTSADGSGISFDPTSSGNAPGRTWAVAIVGIASGTTPGCGEGQKAFSQRRHFVQNCTFSPGVLAAANQTLCNPADPAAISFSQAASSGSTFQWYYQDGTVAAPAAAAPTTGWTLISTAITNSYDPPAGLTISRTFACRVINGVNNQWATGARQITVLHTVNLGTLVSGDQTLCANGDPAPIALAVDPSGSAAFTYKWFYKESVAAACPTGNSQVGWLATAGTSASYDPQSAGAIGRTFALFVTPSGIPSCGTPGWATNCRKIFVGACREAVSDAIDEEGSFGEKQNPELEQNNPNPWSEQTRFSLFLPENAGNTEIRITGLDGRLYKVISVYGTGYQEIELAKEDLPNGLFVYTLWANQQPVAIKKMVLIR